MDIIRLGDTTDNGGVVVTASTTMEYEGRPVARKGDLVDCSLHSEVHPNEIIEGDEEITDNGIPIARHHFRVMCGCLLISTVNDAT
ncbi:PAAR domain-containing protein [Paraburkholderia sp. SIMBA_027]|uniref:PAAR domain-containing protein n=1 Tax=Paraburkholderia sp. SIMBA_027 TaxID=3085770 RepID=UPI0039788B2E